MAHRSLWHLQTPRLIEAVRRSNIASLERGTYRPVYLTEVADRETAKRGYASIVVSGTVLCPSLRCRLEQIPYCVAVQSICPVARGPLCFFFCEPFLFIGVDHVFPGPQVGFFWLVGVCLHDEFVSKQHDKIQWNSQITRLLWCQSRLSRFDGLQ